MKRWLMMVCVLCFLFTGCVAGKVYADQANDSRASCRVIEKELQLAQRKIGVLEEADHTFQKISEIFFT